MYRATWNIEEKLKIEVEHSFWGLVVVRVNGEELLRRRKYGVSKRVDFTLEDGREAQIVIGTDAAIPDFELWIGHEVHRPDDGGENPLGRYHKAQVGAIIWAMVGLFTISGVIYFFLAKYNFAGLEGQLEGLVGEAPFPQPVNGRILTVAEVRRLISYQTWSALGLNLVLAVIMAIIAFWSRRAPLMAILLAAGMYLAVQAANIAMNPSSLGHGLIIKFIVLGLLIKGVLAAISARQVQNE